MRKINNKSPLMLELEERFGLPIEELLRQKYVDEALTFEQIAKQLGIGLLTSKQWVVKAGVWSRRLDVPSEVRPFFYKDGPIHTKGGEGK